MYPFLSAKTFEELMIEDRESKIEEELSVSAILYLPSSILSLALSSILSLLSAGMQERLDLLARRQGLLGPPFGDAQSASGVGVRDGVL